jgi:hypothetical protein
MVKITCTHCWRLLSKLAKCYLEVVKLKKVGAQQRLVIADQLTLIGNLQLLVKELDDKLRGNLEKINDKS